MTLMFCKCTTEHNHHDELLNSLLVARNFLRSALQINEECFERLYEVITSKGPDGGVMYEF